MANFVRFLRGTTAGYNAITTKDNNTLYFISDDNKSGKLYLGEKLIAGEGSSAATTLAALTDVVISEDQTVGSILALNNEGKWIATTPAELVANIIPVMVGATEDADGVSGIVPVPKQSERLLYLRGDATWADPVADLQTILYKDSTEGKSIKEITEAVIAEALAGADENYDTLKEISDWIAKHPDDATAINSSIETLDTRVSSLEIIINGVEADEEAGIEAVDGLTQKVADLEDLVAGLRSDLDGINGLQWIELNDDGSED